MNEVLPNNSPNQEQDDDSTLFRSVEMTKIQLFIPYETSHTSLTILGKMGMVEFVDVIHSYFI